MVQVASKQVHLGCAPQLEQLGHRSLREMPLCGVRAIAQQEVGQLIVDTWSVYHPDSDRSGDQPLE